ncbi:MAG: BamA/TamA family outer membrane protein [Cyclobacteriaceae bacterium]|nr:BamA/TamA family outer membrane protein [Cyclobacteriaceae bacterium]
MKRTFVLEIIRTTLKGKVTKISVGLCAGLLLSGCVGTKYLKDDEKLLFKQSIETPKGFDRTGLRDIYVQKSNRRFLGLPINTLTWMYYWGLSHFEKEHSWFIHSKNDFIRKKEKKEKKFDAKIAAAKSDRKKSNLQFRKQRKMDDINLKIENGNLPMQWGEKVSVYDSAAVTESIQKITSLAFNRGYFKARTRAEVTEKKKRITVVYHLFTGLPFTYDTIIYRVPDSAMHAILIKSLPNAKIHQGERYDQKTLGNERDRLDILMKDHGYYDFSKQYVDFQVDTTYGHHYGIAVQISISDPANRAAHKTFTIDSVRFRTDAGVADRAGKRQSVMYKGIRFNYLVDEYSKRILAQRVFLKNDSLYSRENTFATQRQLANLDIFKFVNINYDTSGGKFIANIFASPLNRYSWTNEAGVTVTQGFPGPYYSLSFKKRNIFQGLEIFELNGRYGFEGVAGATDLGGVYKSTEANVNVSVTFPQFLLPLGKRADDLGRVNPKTKLLIGYTYTDRPEYQRSNVTFSNTYTWENKRTTLYSFTLTNLQVIQSTLDPAFDQLLTDLQTKQGNNLKNSFKPSLVSSMIFSMTWNPQNYGNQERSSYFLRIQAESGGTLFNFYTPDYAISRGLEIYKYLRLGVDFRRNKVIDKNTSVAFRFNSGVAYAYGDNKSLPYEKYWFVGGSNSVRAWRPRRLGIGSAPPPINPDPSSSGVFNYQYERPGEIMLEGSVEWRKKLFGFVNGALFIDAGNVWTFAQSAPANPSEPTTAPWAGDGNTKFYFDSFYKEIAVGTGFGLRFDFSFLVLRLDVGIKVWDPARKVGDRFVLGNFRFTGPYDANREPVIYNIGIGYPF